MTPTVQAASSRLAVRPRARTGRRRARRSSPPGANRRRARGSGRRCRRWSTPEHVGPDRRELGFDRRARRPSVAHPIARRSAPAAAGEGGRSSRSASAGSRRSRRTPTGSCSRAACARPARSTRGGDRRHPPMRRNRRRAAARRARSPGRRRPHRGCRRSRAARSRFPRRRSRIAADLDLEIAPADVDQAAVGRRAGRGRRSGRCAHRRRPGPAGTTAARALGIAPVAGRDVAAAHRDLADFAVGDLAPRLVEQQHVLVRQRTADRQLAVARPACRAGRAPSRRSGTRSARTRATARSAARNAG